MSVSVCLSVRSLISKNHASKLHETFLCLLTLTVARSSFDDSAIRYVLPVLWMTSRSPSRPGTERPMGRIVKVTHRGPNGRDVRCLRGAATALL